MSPVPARGRGRAAPEGAPSSFFEGPEKKVELVLREGHGSFRALGRAFYERVVRAAGAHILSARSNAHLDAYLLSESSLFVYDRELTMITCGRTRLADAVVLLVSALPEGALAMLVYERKAEHFPEAQPTQFEDDAQQLAALVPGRAISFGADDVHAVHVFHSLAPYTPGPRDRTLEVLMHGIPERCTAPLREGARGGLLGLPRALAGFELDEHVFEPAGYSLNGLAGAAYVTLHVTPEAPGSYVSLETNVDPGEAPVAPLVEEAAARFEPDALDVLAFEPSPEPLSFALGGYTLRARSEALVAGYCVKFLRFVRG